MRTAHRLYFRLPVVLQNLAISLYGVKLRRARYGTTQRRVAAELAVSERWPPERLDVMQLELLRAQLRRAATVPLYRSLGFPSPDIATLAALRDMPTVTKAQLQRPRHELIAAGRENERLEEIHTGGTTGKPLVIYCDRETLQRNYAFFERFRRWAGIGREDRTAVFAGRLIVPPEQRRPPFWRRNFASRALLLSSYHLSAETLASYAEALRRFRPALIDSYPSSIEPLARWLLEAGTLDIRPRAVITSSETLAPATRDRISAAFGCPVFDHYGAAEMAALITQCEHGTYHVNPEFGVVEILKPDGSAAAPGEEGEIVATGFINTVMPLIRYRTGDLAVLGEARCGCGRAFPVVQRIIGRMDDVVITPSGRRIGRLDPIFKATSGILETRIVQDRRDRVVLELVPASGFRPEDEASLVDELRHRLGPDMAIEVRHVDAIPRAGSGKLRTVVNLIDKRSGERTPQT